jgi:hypothetical protein
MDPTTFELEEPTFSVMLINVKTIKIIIKQVDPKKDLFKYKLNLLRFKNFNYNIIYFNFNFIVRKEYSYGNKFLEVKFGKVVLDSYITTNCKDDEPTEIKINLSKYLQFKNMGHLQVIVRPGKKSKKLLIFLLNY